MRLMAVLVCACLAIFTQPMLVHAQDAGVDRYENGVNAYFAGEYELSVRLLTIVIDDGSEDARVWYFRGLAHHAAGDKDAAAADFAAGGQIEVEQRTVDAVNVSLERIQGPARQLLEQHRRTARREKALASDPYTRGKAVTRIYTRSRAEYFAGRYESARELLDPVLDDSQRDPRLYYFRGLALYQLGETEAANTDFSRALLLELDPTVRVDVDRALERIQGPARIALETQRRETLSVARQTSREERDRMIAAIVARRMTEDGSTASPKANAVFPMATASTAPTQTTAPATQPATTPAASATATAGSSLDLSWLPADTEVLVHVRVADIWNSALVRGLRDMPDVQQSVTAMETELGIGPGDLDTVTVGMFGVSELAMSAAADPAAAQQQGTQQLVAIVRTRLPIDPGIIENRTDDLEKSDHNGQTWYRSIQPGGPSVFIINSKTILLADEATLTSVLDNGAGTRPEADFSFVDVTRQVVIAVAPRDLSLITDAPAPQATGSPALDKLLPQVQQQLTGAAISFGIDANLTLEVSLNCRDDAGAAGINDSLTELMNEASGLWNLSKGVVPPGLARIVDGLLRSQKTAARGTVASVSVRMTGNAVEAAITEAKEALPLLMMAALSGGGGGSVTLTPGGDSASGFTPPAAPAADRKAADVQVTGTAGVSTELDFENPTSKVLEITLDLIGGDAGNAVAVGFPALTAATDSAGNTLELLVDQFGRDGFTRVDRNGFVQHPDGGCRTAIRFKGVTDIPDAIASASGTVKLLLVDESSDIVLDNAKSLLDQTLSNAELEAAGYQLELKPDADDASIWQVNWANVTPQKMQQARGGAGLQIPEIVDADGNVLVRFSGVTSVQAGNSAQYSWSASVMDPASIPDDARLRMSLVTKVTVAEVDFSVSDLTIDKSGQ